MRDVIREVIKDVNKDVIRDVIKDVNKDVIRDVIKDVNRHFEIKLVEACGKIFLLYFSHFLFRTFSSKLIFNYFFHFFYQQ